MTHNQPNARIDQKTQGIFDVLTQEPTILASPTHVEMEELVSPLTLIQRTCAGVRKDSLELIVKKARNN